MAKTEERMEKGGMTESARHPPVGTQLGAGRAQFNSDTAM